MSVHPNSRRSKNRDQSQMELAKAEKAKHEEHLRERAISRERRHQAAAMAKGAMATIQAGKMAVVRHPDVLVLTQVQSALLLLAKDQGVALETKLSLSSGMLVATKVVWVTV